MVVSFGIEAGRVLRSFCQGLFKRKLVLRSTVLYFVGPKRFGQGSPELIRPVHTVQVAQRFPNTTPPASVVSIKGRERTVGLTSSFRSIGR
jgi:hypothetical protein